MNSRERTLAAINHQQPDRPPIYVSLTPQLAKKLSEALGLPYEPPIDAMESARMSHMGLLAHMGVDIIATAITAPPSAPTVVLPDGRVKNEWGMILKNAGLYDEFDEFRKVRPDIKIAWHSCGSILPIIPDFIEIGLDILNPIQPLAKGMEPEFLKETYGKDLVFFGGIDVQELLPYGTPQMIRDEVRRRIDILGKDGGFIVAPAHNIQPDTSLENVFAFFDAVKEYK